MSEAPQPDIVLPTREDPVVRASTPLIGGAVGRFAAIGAATWWTPVRVLIVMGALAWMLGGLLDLPCMANSWGSPDNYEHLCYSDIPPLYGGRGFADGYLPYLELAPGGRLGRRVDEELAAEVRRAIPGAHTRIEARPQGSTWSGGDWKPADIGRARRVLGYEPRYPMPLLLADYADWYRRRRRAA